MSHIHSPKKRVIVAVGASAGGLQALKEFFDNIPLNSPFTYVIIQHLSPDHKSLMAELLSRNTEIPIQEITDDIDISPNCVYLIPPGSNLIIDNNHFRLLDKPKDKSLNLPIDIFFESMANHCGENCAGIILSGTGSDGSKGLKSLKANGGLILVQEPKEAKFNGMPQNAIDTGMVDKILPVSEMGDELTTYFEGADTKGFVDADDIDFAEDLLLDILGIIHKKNNVDFSFYKRPTLHRRIAKRLRVLKINSLEEYLSHIKNHDEEIDILHQEFLIGVTKFFRDTKLWEILRDKVVPKMVKNKKPGDVLKVWDVGCSTGEEAYSLAIVIHEEIEKQKKDIDLKIFATDISSDHIKQAQSGDFDLSIINDFDNTRLSKYFQKEKELYKIKDVIRKKIIFSAHNVVKDPPFSSMDMVMCRNLLIYLQKDIQGKILETLHYSLLADGILILGSSETLSLRVDYFEEISRKWKIFANKESSKKRRKEILKSTINRVETSKPKITSSSNGTMEELNHSKLKGLIGESIMGKFGAASVYVDKDFKILEALGEFYKYASLPTSGFTTNLLSMVPEKAKNVISSASRKASKSGVDVIYKDVALKKAETTINVDVLARAVKVKDSYNYIITLVEKEPHLNDEAIIEEAATHQSSAKRIAELEEELSEVKHELKTSIEETETSNEELQASNEELLASNEELQSTNEELQSVNEELHSVNTEHLQKMEDLALLNAEMDSLVNNLDIGTVYVDKNLYIRKFTPAIQSQFKLRKEDVGRPISDFVNQFDQRKKNTLIQHLNEVIEYGISKEKRVVNEEGKWFLKRISPFKRDGKIEGALITFIDIDKIHISQEKLKASEEKFKMFYEHDPIMHISVKTETIQVIECNELLVKVLGLKSKSEIIGRSILEFYDKESKIKALEILEEFKKTGKIKNKEMVLVSKDGERIHVLLNSEAIRDKDGNVIESRSTFTDIRDLKKARMEMERQQEELRRINQDLEQFVSICSHDLQEPLSTIRFSSDFLLKKYSENLNGKGKEYLGYIHNASGRMAQQIKALLEHSRIGQNLEKKKVDIAEVIEVVKYDISRRIKDKNAKIHVGKMPVLYGYETELRLLFQNLISNAIKYSKEDVSPEIRISAYKEGEYWVFSVTDNGIGIKEENLQAVFQIFGRVDSNEDKYDGTGVGLAHAQKIVNLHDGKIWVDSQFGVGSTFYFKLKAE